MESTENMIGMANPYETQSDKEMFFRQKYLKQPNETKEQRDERNKNVRNMLSEARDAQIGVKDQTVLNAFNAGKGRL